MSRVKESESSWPAPSPTRPRLLKVSTKQQLAAMPKPISYSCPDIPIKVRRSLARRAAAMAQRNFARIVWFRKEASLSASYNNELPESYMEQVFTSIHKIGQGCFGDVFQTLCKEDSKMYAIKVINDTHAFIDFGEVRRLEKIPNHKNCVKFYKAWQEACHLYIQMELCKTSLDKLLMVNHHIRETQCWDILTDIAQGLKHLHNHQLIHLDIKPANIMISAQGVCKLGDFGLLIDLEDVNPDTKARKRTGLSVSEGDGKYVALEVLRGNIYTKAADIFSFGLMMLEVSSDVALPSSGADWENIRNGMVPECYHKRKLSQNFKELINSMIVKDYTKRPTVTEILNNPVVVSNCKRTARTNYVEEWDTVWQKYLETHPDNDIPTVQIEGPSPPRRSYPINYVPPRSAQRMVQTDLMYNNNKEDTPQSANRLHATRKIARRLVF